LNVLKHVSAFFFVVVLFVRVSHNKGTAAIVAAFCM